MLGREVADQGFEAESLLLTALHILERTGVGRAFFFSYEHDKGDLEAICIAHLLLHLHRLGVDL